MAHTLSLSELESQEYSLIDARGLLFPEPVMLLHNTIRKANEGTLIKVLATDSSTERDVLNFCEHLNHPLLYWHKEADIYTYWVKKKQRKVQSDHG